ncbi:type II toxin-antitoxin system RelE/ParE family toxin [Dyadobacter sandarakinus]|uniref:Type II toxin-antitoxin system RelE/ParE family toxin n=1 Tax=Dyadobacter sandarakinus TaxID=2747268 RepID=A0ABX7I2F3_9BACT|nr:type II toxin-antitoxin system RelE/ParE family toxin [Dyadobacter sandarakinus]
MTFEIRWTSEAETSFREIVAYLEAEWTEKEARKFIRRARTLFSQIAKFPFMCEASNTNKKVRRGFVTKQCSLFYEINDDVIVLLYFWDNRANPDQRAH